MPTFDDAEGGLSVRTKINAAITVVDTLSDRGADKNLVFDGRAAMEAWVADGGTAPDGSIASDGTVQYVADSGATAISDLGGWLPFGEATPLHWQENTIPGTTNMYTALSSWLAYIAGGVGFIPKGIYRFTDKLTVPDYTVIRGAGRGEWVLTNNVNDGIKSMDKGSILLYTANKAGVGDENLIGVTDNRTGGGRFANDSSLDANDGTYSLTSFYNDDANTTTGAAATPRDLSVAVKMGSGAQMSDLRVMLSFDGTTATDGFRSDWNPVDGYTNIPSGLGTASCDIGILRQRADATLERVDVIGYWRVAGVADVFVEYNRGGDNSNAAWQAFRQQSTERSRTIECNIQGQVSYLCRGGDYHKVLARTSSTVDVEWADNHPFDVTLLNGEFRGGGVVGARLMNFTGTQFVAGSPNILRLTGVTPDPTTVSGLDPTNDESVICPMSGTLAVAGTILEKCVLVGMNHGSVQRITQANGVSNPKPSACAELSGHALRDVTFSDCRFSGQEDIAVFCHNANTVSMIGQTTCENIATSLEPTNGMRFIASPYVTENTRVANPAGYTTLWQVLGTMVFGQCDFRPDWNVVTFTDQTRFGGNGYFAPQRSYIRQAVLADTVNGAVVLRGPVGGRVALGTDDGGVGFEYDGDTGNTFLRGGPSGAQNTYLDYTDATDEARIRAAIIRLRSRANVDGLIYDANGLYAPLGLKLGGTGAANLLDYYEEGTWTPVLSDGTNNATASVAAARYTRVGNDVSGTIRIVLSSKGAISGSLRITGWPFASVNSSSGQGGGFCTQMLATNFVSGRPPILRTAQNTTYAFLVKDGGAGAYASVNDADLTDTSELQFRYNYTVA